ncbi:MAG: hypothetical protein AB7O37_18580 [Vicinamibacteria bacterium]
MRLRRLVARLPIVLAFVVVLNEGRAATRGLEWPWDYDQFRNIAQAQTAADGGWLADPFYAGESVFYNPLLAWVTGMLVGPSGPPIHAFQTQLGSALDLLGPIALLVLLRRWLGRAPAEMALLYLLFFNLGPAGSEPFWSNPTYSPWMVAQNLAEPFFFASLVALGAAVSRPRAWRYAATGVLVGLTFLAHTGPLPLFLVLLVAELVRSRRSRSLRPRDVLLIGAVAALVAAPFLASILGRYGAHVQNAAPILWRWLPELRQAGPVLAAQLPWTSAFALMGLALCWRKRRRPGVARLLVLSGSALVFFLLGFAHDIPWLRRVSWIQLVPQHHFWFYLRVFEAALVGLAWAALLGLGFHRLKPYGVTSGRRAALRGALVAVAVLVALPGYRQRTGLVAGRQAIARQHHDLRGVERRRLWEWLRHGTQPREVFLASDLDALLVVAPAGRRVLALDEAFSSPYVDLRPRVDARNRLLRLLAARRWPRLLALAHEWNVRHVLLPAGEALPADAPLALEFSTALYRVYGVPSG